MRSATDIRKVVDNFPAIFGNSNWKHNVIFLSDEINSKGLLKSLPLRDGIEQLLYRKGVLYWSAQIKTITRSNMIKLSSKPEYQQMTVRNPNTIRRIVKMLDP
jgi:uncharacterized protein (DUF1697 family)